MTTLERNQLIENYMPLANKLAVERKKTLPRKIDLEEIKSAAYFGLVDAAQKFDVAKSVSFGTYARIRIVGEIQDFIRESYKNDERYGISLYQPDATTGDCLINNLSQGRPTKFFDDFFASTIDTLSDLDKNIVMMYYVEDLSLKEIGVQIGLSESRVSQLLKRCHESIRTKWFGPKAA